MSNIANLVGWAMIGTPAGLQTKNGGCISNFDIGGLVDINNLVIKPLPNSEILCLLRENRNGSLIHYYILYRYAKEIKTDRPGAFYGSVLVIVNNILRGDIALNVLREIANYLSKYISPEQRFTTNINSLDLPIPVSIQTVINSLQPINPNQSVKPNEGLLELSSSSPEAQSNFFSFVSRPAFALLYSRVYGSADKDVISYIKERGKIKTIDTNKIESDLKIAQLVESNELLKDTVTSIQSEKALLEKRYQTELAQKAAIIDSLEKENEFLKEAPLKEQTNSDEITSQKDREISRLKDKVTELERKISSYKQVQRSTSNTLPNYHKSEHESDSEQYRRYGDSIFGNYFKDSKFLTLVICLICLIIVLALVLWPEISSIFNHKESIIYENVEPQTFERGTSTATQSEFSSQNINIVKEKANSYLLSIKDNKYDSSQITTLLNKLNNLNLNKDSIYISLDRVYNNYCFTNKPLKDLEKHIYNVKRGDNSVKTIMRHIEQENYKASMIHSFEKSFRAANNINKETKFEVGEKLIYYIPK